MKFPSLTDLVRRALHRNRDHEDLQAEAASATPHKMGLPTTWSNGDQTVTGKVLAPSKADMKLIEPVTTCGSCRYFNIKRGQEQMVREQFADRLVNEDGWALRHLGAPVDHLGLCEQSGGSMLTSTVSKACEHYRARTGRTGRWALS